MILPIQKMIHYRILIQDGWSRQIACYNYQYKTEALRDYCNIIMHKRFEHEKAECIRLTNNTTAKTMILTKKQKNGDFKTLFTNL